MTQTNNMCIIPQSAEFDKPESTGFARLGTEKNVPEAGTFSTKFLWLQ